MRVTTRVTAAIAGCGMALGMVSSPLMAQDKEPIRIGVMASLSGAFAQMGADGVDGVKLAVEEFGGEINGRPVKLFIEDSAMDPSVAVEKTRALVNRDGAQVVLGPLSGAAGLAVKKGAGEFPDATIIVAGSAAEDITMRGVAPNVFRTSYTGAQPTFPLGDYAYDQGYRKVAIVAEDYAFPYAQVGGFMKTFCARGGSVPKKIWVPIGTSDYSSAVAQIPPDVDALFVALGGTDAVNFIRQMDDFGLLDQMDILGGTVTVDGTQLASIGPLMEGVVSGSIMSGQLDNDAYKSLDRKFGELRGRPPSLFVENYYRAAKWALLALEDVDGNVEDQEALRKELLQTSFQAPGSFVSFDRYHNVVPDVYLNRVEKVNGEWRNVPIRTYSRVSQFWTFDPEQYQAAPAYDRDTPSCP
ncbi:ABC transporter substrate-binding protein [Arhodomonas sp. KWT2]|uniref:ABC transporter substrate-binding protein n=2 Tax=unclassified Arhodomonas TaxID=2621637 RepID=UPI0035C0D244